MSLIPALLDSRVAEAQMTRKKPATRAMMIERDRQIWDYITRQGWTQVRVAEQLGIKQPQVSVAMRRLSERAVAQMDKDVIAQKQKQIGILENMLMEVLEAWEKSKQGKKTVGRNTTKRMMGPVDANGKVTSAEAEETVNSRQTMTDTTGDTRYVAEARAIMADLRKLLGFGDEVKVNLSWQSMLPTGYEPDEVARQFAELMQVKAEE